MVNELVAAIRAWNKGLAQELLENGADVNAFDAGGRTPLMRCVSSSGTHLVPLLLDAGADVNTADEDGVTALMLAAYYGAAGAVKRLLGAGANAKAKDAQGRTALQWANTSPYWGKKETQQILKAA